jgi:hypothetical protein
LIPLEICICKFCMLSNIIVCNSVSSTQEGEAGTGSDKRNGLAWHEIAAVTKPEGGIIL